MNEGSKFLHILINPDYVWFFFLNYSNSSKCEVVSQYSFDLHFPNDIDYLFICLVANYIFS